MKANNKTMREALEAILKEANTQYRNDNGIDLEWLMAKAKAALDAPPRNCDRFKNADEAIEAVDTHCEHAANGCIGCPAAGCYSYDTDCRIAWLFAPATEKEGGAK